MSDRHPRRSLVEVVVASPLFLLSPACRRWHLRWGATDEEVAVAMPGDWSWRLTPLETGSSRLVTRLKQRYAWRDAPANALLTFVLLEVADFPMMRKLLLGVRARAERLAGGSGRGRERPEPPCKPG